MIANETEVKAIQEIVFDYAPDELEVIQSAVALKRIGEPVAPRQYFPVVEPPQAFPPLPWNQSIQDRRFLEASLKDPR